MRRLSLALAVAALAAAPLAGTSNAGCVDDLLRSSSPGLGGTVEVDPQQPLGPVTVDPRPAVNFTTATAGTVVAFVNCVV